MLKTNNNLGKLNFGICSSAFLLMVLLFSFPPSPVFAQPPELTDNQWEELVKSSMGNIPKMLQLLPLAKPEKGSDLRKKISKLLFSFTKEDQEKLLLDSDLQAILIKVIKTPEESTELMGKQGTISRQILYRHYLENQIFESPLPLVYTWDLQRGKNPILRKVVVWKP